MGTSHSRKLIAYLPLSLAATFAVVMAPTLFVLWLRESGAVNSMWVALAIGVVISLVLSQVGAVIWKTKANSDLLFNDLMLWGWLQRMRSERRLAAAADLLGLSAGRPKAITGGQLTSDQKKSLLTQLSSSLESSDPYTHGHSRRVARHAANIAKQMGLSGPEIAKIRAAGVMHDVGKVETPTTVLHKAGRLSDEEFDIVKRHPVDGADMVAMLDDDELTAMVRHHHERMDGTGYPDGLAGEDIPLGARILAVADTFDAITSTRPYRQANPHKKALDILETEAGTQLDPLAVRAFLECYSGLKPVAFWAVLMNARPRVGASLGQFFSPVTGTNVMATTAAAAAAGAVAVGPGAHTVPASSQPDAADATLASTTTPFSRGSHREPLMFASVLAERDAKDSSGGGFRAIKPADVRDELPTPQSSADRKSAPGQAPPAGDHAPRNRTGASDGPAGGGGDTSAPTPDADKGKGTGGGNGNANGHSKPRPVTGNGNSYGHSKPRPVPGNGNANGQNKGTGGNGNGNGLGLTHGQGNGNGQANGNGLGKGLEKVKEKASPVVTDPPPPAPGKDLRTK